jgi:hypothetical protein
LPLLLRRAGFQNVSVEIELDRLYTAIGTIEPELRRNLVELLTPAMPRVGQILGGPEQAERFLSDLLAYLDSPDTCTYTQLWIIKGTA